MMYSIIPNEVIFSEANFQQENKIISFSGEILEVSHMEANRYRVNRILSTNLKAYLNPQMQPGSVIQYDGGDDYTAQGSTGLGTVK